MTALSDFYDVVTLLIEQPSFLSCYVFCVLRTWEGHQKVRNTVVAYRTTKAFRISVTRCHAAEE
jgi:hypothetical protein